MDQYIKKFSNNGWDQMPSFEEINQPRQTTDVARLKEMVENIRRMNKNAVVKIQIQGGNVNDLPEELRNMEGVGFVNENDPQGINEIELNE